MKTLLAFLVSVAFVSVSLQAQDWAKARLEKSPRHMEWVKVKHGDREVNCFVVYPEIKDKATAVLVVHEIFGLTDWAREAADEVAAAGYIAIAPDLLSGMAPGGGGTAEIGGRDAAMKAISSLPPDQVTADLNAAADYVTKLPSCNGKVVVGGFCWGGGQSFRYATDNKNLKAAFVFYGPPPAAGSLSPISSPIYGFYGGNDNRITASVPKTTAQMKEAGKTYEPVTYESAGHGFMRDGEDPTSTDPNHEANIKAREEAWKRWKELLGKI
jgi:carboxymethylenebutenolidase